MTVALIASFWCIGIIIGHALGIRACLKNPIWARHYLDGFCFKKRQAVRERQHRYGSTATAYRWIIWRKDAAGEPTHFHWIAPCRKRLERKEDYQEKEE